jgi:guanylate kinase
MSTDPGTLLVLAGPSGSGKTTLARRMVSGRSGMRFSVSATTRKARGTEVDGVDYEFVTDEEFDRRIASGFFLEWAEVHGSRYGTSAGAVREALASGSGIVLDIDVQGALNVRSRVPGALLVFVLPPSPDMLEDRLDGRGTEEAGGLARRLSAAANEVRWCGSFDYVIVNDLLEASVARLESVLAAARLSADGSAYPREAAAFDAGLLDDSGYWSGRKVLVTAGPTREPIDDVRFVSNRSTGRMGCSLACAFRDLGASVTLLLGPCSAPAPPGVDLARFETASDLQELLSARVGGTDLLAMAAAVADYRPRDRAPGKIPRSPSGLSMDLEQVPDILEGLSAGCPVLAFGLEFGPDPVGRSRAKMEKKKSFAVFVNRGDVPGIGMEAEGNEGVVLFADGSSAQIPLSSKRFSALALAAAVGRYLAKN